MKTTAIIILAAGSSSRLGQPKQLLSYQDKSLLNNTIEAANKAFNGKVLVILGGNQELVAPDIDQNAVQILYNADWEEGISSSIRVGISELEKSMPALSAVILSVCDQPFITAGIFEGLISEADRSGKSIVASKYGDTFGTPVLFCQKHFNDLAVLKGKEGAKTIVAKFKDQVGFVPFEKGEIDIDTPEDYNRLLSTL